MNEISVFEMLEKCRKCGHVVHPRSPEGWCWVTWLGDDPCLCGARGRYVAVVGGETVWGTPAADGFATISAARAWAEGWGDTADWYMIHNRHGNIIARYAREMSTDSMTWRKAIRGAVSLPGNDLVGTAEIAQRANVQRATVQAWTERHPNFPEPCRDLVMGRLWWWSDVAAWLAIPRRPGRPRRSA